MSATAFGLTSFGWLPTNPAPPCLDRLVTGAGVAARAAGRASHHSRTRIPGRHPKDVATSSSAGTLCVTSGSTALGCRVNRDCAASAHSALMCHHDLSWGSARAASGGSPPSHLVDATATSPADVGAAPARENLLNSSLRRGRHHGMTPRNPKRMTEVTAGLAAALTPNHSSKTGRRASLRRQKPLMPR